MESSKELLKIANKISVIGLKKIDSLHLACAIIAKCDCFFTVDDRILKKKNFIADIKILNPVEYITEIKV